MRRAWPWLSLLVLACHVDRPRGAVGGGVSPTAAGGSAAPAQDAASPGHELAAGSGRPATDARSIGPSAGARYELPAQTPLPETRSLPVGGQAGWLDEHHIVMLESSTSHVVAVDVRTGKLATLSDWSRPQLSIGGGRWAVWGDLARPEELLVHDGAGRRLWEVTPAGPIHAVALGAGATFVATGRDVRRHDRDGAVRWTQALAATRLVASPDGRWLLVADGEEPAQVVRAADGVPVQVLDRAVCAAAFSADGSRLALAIATLDTSVRWPRGPVVVYDTTSWQGVASIDGRGGCGGLAFAPDGRLGVYGDEVVSIWDLGRGQGQAFAAHTGGLHGWGPAGLLLVSSVDGELRLLTR